MGHRPTVILSALVIAASLTAADPLDSVFAHIDASAKTFRSVSADITDTEHKALVNVDDSQTAVFRLVKSKDGIHMKAEYQGAQTVAYDPRMVQDFNPKTRTVDEYNLTQQQQEKATQLLTLGFGATSAELKSAYDVTYVGEDKIGSENASHLKLIPKAADVKKSVKQADLWFGPNGIVVQQKFLFPSGDYKLVKYMNVQLGNVSEKDVELKLPKGTTVQKH